MIRVSSNSIYEQGVGALLRQQQELLRIQQQVASGRRILTPADDPVAAARVLDVTQAASLNSQYAENRNAAQASLGLTESVLQSVTDLIQDVRTTVITASNPALNDSDRTSLATVLRNRLEQLIDLANSTDASGQYLFSGYQGAAKPFVQTAAGVQYSGDQGQRLIQASAARQIAVSNPGSEVFERIRNGNGVFVVAAAAANAGSGVTSPGTVTAPASLTGHEYQINFTVAAGTITYDVVDITTAATLSSGNPYTSGNAISFDGIQLEIQGGPADGDQFSVAASSNQSLFTTLSDLLATVAAPASSPADNARLTNGLNRALLDLDRGLDHVLGVRAVVGARLQEADALHGIGENFMLHYQQTLSQLQDLDYAQALSDLTRQHAYLEAAQKSFLQVSGLSLFNYL